MRTEDGKIVGPENTSAVTSVGWEDTIYSVPKDLNDAGIIASNNNSMQYASINAKETAIITLTMEKVQANDLFFTESSKLDYQGMCDKGLD